MATSRKRRCSYGIKKNGQCKKKSGRPSKQRSRKSSKNTRKRRCSYGVKKNGQCKKKSGRPSKQRSRKPSKNTYMTTSRCKTVLQDKIRTIIRERKYGNKQSVAIAYSMVGKKYPNCKKIFERSRKRKS